MSTFWNPVQLWDNESTAAYPGDAFQEVLDLEHTSKVIVFPNFSNILICRFPLPVQHVLHLFRNCGYLGLE
jgi:hypothetical protein